MANTEHPDLRADAEFYAEQMALNEGAKVEREIVIRDVTVFTIRYRSTPDGNWHEESED